MSKQYTETEIIKLWESVERGEATSMVLLAVCYEQGNGTEANPALAYHLMEKAAEKGDTQGLWRLGYYLYCGTGCYQNKEKGLEYIQKAVDKGDAHAKDLIRQLQVLR